MSAAVDEAREPMTAAHIAGLIHVARVALDAWDRMRCPGRFMQVQGYAEADAIVRLGEEVLALRAQLAAQQDHTDAAVDGVRAMLPAALKVAREEGAAAMRERVAVLAEEHAIDASDAAFPFIMRVARDARALPLDAPGGGS